MWRIQQVAITQSTNDEAMRAAEAGQAEGLVICAQRQSAGRGRHGRVWESPEGNLYCSLLLRPKAGDNGAYSFVAALALREVVQEMLPSMPVTLKWPNDVLADGKKIAGILLEAGENWLVVGVGLNVAQAPKDTPYPATSLHAMGAAETDLRKILDHLLEAFGYWYAAKQKSGFGLIRAAWLEHAQKGPLSVKLPHEVIHGDFAGLNDQGHLCLRLENSDERVITSGDVFIL